MSNSGLNGNPIPAQLPPELVPPSSKDLGNTVDFMKDLLRHDTNQRYTSSPSGADSPTSQSSYAKSRSLYQQNQPPARQDASAYRHDDRGFKTYKSSSRHIDRRAVRAANDDSPTGDLSDMRRALDSSSAMLESSRDDQDLDEALLQEKDDLMYSIRRIQDDIAHNSKGRRTDAKDSERRRLERQLDEIKYDRLPALESRMEEREDAKSRARRRDAVDRDSRNRGDRGRFDHEEHRARSRYDFDDEPRRRSYDSPSRDENDESRGYMRGTFDSDSSPRPSARSPPPPAPKPAAPKAAPPKPASPAPVQQPAMSAEQRKEYIKNEAARRVQDRLRALGIGGDTSAHSSKPSSPAPPEPTAQPSQATDVQAEADEREKQRQIRLQNEKLEKEAAALAEEQKALEQVNKEVTASEVKHPSSSASVGFQAARDTLDDEERQMREREEALKKQRAEQQERLRRLEEEMEADRKAEEEFKARRDMFAQKSQAAPAPPPPSVGGPRKAPPPKPPASRTPKASPAPRQ